jgi:hypothetical protein
MQTSKTKSYKVVYEPFVSKSMVKPSVVKIIKVLEKTLGGLHAWVLALTPDNKEIRIRKPVSSIPKELL